MNKKNTKISFTNMQKIYFELQTLFTLHKIEQEALAYCYDENSDFGHIFALDTIFTNKFKTILNSFNNILEK